MPIAIYLARRFRSHCSRWWSRETRGSTSLMSTPRTFGRSPHDGDDGRTALVTGAASWDRRGVRASLAARGATVTVADIDDGPRPWPAESASWAVDLLDVAALESLKLDCDILVNNAGADINPIEDFPPDKFRMLRTLMVEAPFLIRAALPHMYSQDSAAS